MAPETPPRASKNPDALRLPKRTGGGAGGVGFRGLLTYPIGGLPELKALARAAASATRAAKYLEASVAAKRSRGGAAAARR